MRAPPLLAMLSVALLAAGCRSGTAGAGAQGESSGSIGAGGGIVGTPSTGEIIVPAGALSGPTTITIGPGTPITAPGYQTTGLAFKLGPQETAFAVPVEVAIPVVVPAGHTLGDMVVLKREDATGLVTVVLPIATGPAPQEVTVSVTSFSTIQGAVSTGSPPGVFGLSRFGQATFQ